MTDGPSAQIDFYISYTDRDERWAEWIAWNLEEAGYRTVIQAWDFRPGSNFVQSMQDASVRTQRTVAVLSPNYLASGITQSEWHAAFAQDPTGEKGKLVPVRVAECELMGLLPQIVPINLVGLEEHEARRRLLEGINQLRVKPTRAPTFPGVEQSTPIFPGLRVRGVPDRPTHFQPRGELLSGLREQLLRTAEPVGITGTATVGVYGMGGIGKSILAAELTRDGQIRDAFPDGIYWLTIGQQAFVVAQLIQLAKWLGDPSPTIDDERSGREVLQGLIDGRKCLLILDDVWQYDAIRPFVQVGDDCRLVITTRDASILGKAGASEYLVEQLPEVDALRWLAEWSGVDVTKLPEEAAAVASQCGYLPLALSICGAMVHEGNNWGDLLLALRDADLAYLDESVSYQYKDVLRSMEVSLKTLEVAAPNEVARYRELAVFPEDAVVPEAAVTALWGYTGGLKPRDTRKLLVFLQRKSLLRLDGQTPRRTISLHDLQADYLTATTEDIASLHRQVIEAYRRTCGGTWWRQADDDYFHRRIGWHFVKASQLDEFKLLVFDVRWLEAWLKATDPFTMIDAVEAISGNTDTRSLAQALRMGAHVLAKDAGQLRTQVFGRLMQSQSPSLCHARSQCLELPSDRAWLHLRTPTLTQAGALLQLTLEGHVGRVTAVALKTDEQCVSSSFDGTLKVWDLATGVCQRTLEGHAGSVTAVAVDSDGRAVSGSRDRTLKVWDLCTGECRRTLKAHPGPVKLVAITADGRAVSSSGGGTLKVWDLESGECQWTLRGHTTSINAVAVTPDALLLSASGDRTLKVWDLATGECKRTLKGHAASVRTVGVTADGRAVSGSKDGTLKVWDLSTGICQRTLDSRAGWIRTLVVTGDGRIFSVSADNKLRIWDLETGECQRTLEGHFRDVFAVAITADGRLVSASADHSLKVWDLASGESHRTLEGHDSSVTALAVTADGRAVSASENDRLIVWDVAGGNGTPTREKHAGSVTAVAVTPDGRAVSASIDNTLKIWDLATGECQRILRGHQKGVTSVAITADGRIVSGSGDRTLKVWDLDSGDCLTTFEGHAGSVRAVAVMADGRLVSASADHTLKVWNRASGQCQQTLTGHTDSVRVVALTANGHAVSASDDGTLKVWDLTTGECRQTLKGHSGRVRAIGVTPDGRVVSGSDDGGLKVWDLATGECQATLEGHANSVRAVVVMVDGRVVSVSADHTLKVWDLTNGELVATFNGEAPMRSISVAWDGTLLAGDSLGHVHILDLRDASPARSDEGEP